MVLMELVAWVHRMRLHVWRQVGELRRHLRRRRAGDWRASHLVHLVDVVHVKQTSMALLRRKLEGCGVHGWMLQRRIQHHIVLLVVNEVRSHGLLLLLMDGMGPHMV